MWLVAYLSVWSGVSVPGYETRLLGSYSGRYPSTPRVHTLNTCILDRLFVSLHVPPVPCVRVCFSEERVCFISVPRLEFFFFGGDRVVNACLRSVY